MNKNLGNKFTPEVDLEINFVKTLIKNETLNKKKRSKCA